MVMESSAGIDKTSWVSGILDKMNLKNGFAKNVTGSTIKGLMVGGGTGTVAGAFKANVSKDWRDVFGGMFNGIIYGAGAGLVSSLVMEVGYQLQLRNGRTPVNSADMIDAIKSNTGEIVRYCDPSYMNYNYWDSSTPTLFKDYMQYFNEFWNSNMPSLQIPNLPSQSTGIKPIVFPY